MAADLSRASFSLTFGLTQPPSNVLLSGAQTGRENQSTTYSSGTAANQANRGHLNQYTLTPSQTLTLDLNDGTQKDLNGDAITFARVRAIFLQHDPTSQASGVKLDGAAANVISALRSDTLPPGCAIGEDIPVGNGLVLTNATADKLVIVNLDATKNALVNLGLAGASV